MAGPAQAAVRAALATAKRLCWVDVIYVVGDDRIQLRAVKTEQDVEQIQGDGTAIVARVTDWRILREDLVADGAELRPARGHRIEYWLGSLKQTYEVQPGAGEREYLPGDPWEMSWKVRTKLIAETDG
jgi:hypothetical protein